MRSSGPGGPRLVQGRPEQIDPGSARRTNACASEPVATASPPSSWRHIRRLPHEPATVDSPQSAVIRQIVAEKRVAGTLGELIGRGATGCETADGWPSPRQPSNGRREAVGLRLGRYPVRRRPSAINAVAIRSKEAQPSRCRYCTLSDHEHQSEHEKRCSVLTGDPTQ